MTVYRIYLLDQDQRIRRVVAASCASDEEARAQAEELLDTDASAEVWDRTRRVCTFPVQVGRARSMLRWDMMKGR